MSVKVIQDAIDLLYKKKWSRCSKEKAFNMLENVFDDNQLAYIRRGYEQGLSQVLLELLADPCFSWQQMMVLSEALRDIPLNKIDYLTNPRLNFQNMSLLATGIRKGLSHKQLMILARPGRTIVETKVMLGAFEYGVSPEEIEGFLQRKRSYYE